MPNAFHSNLEAITLVATGDLSALQYRVVDLFTTVHKVTVAGAAGGYGVLLNKPRHGEHASVAIKGQTEVRVGAAVAIGADLTSAASGWAVTITSGASQRVIGRALTAAASGMLATVNLNPTFASTGAG